jgi:alginate O-acetyltransferase complex protein AlgI
VVFTEPFFLFVFLPCTLLAYWAAPARWRNSVLLISSIAFYAIGQQSDVLVLLASIGVNAAAGFVLATSRSAMARSAVVIAGIVGNLGILAWFKYSGFLTANLDAIIERFGWGGVAIPAVALPVGISFFTFQAMSYLIDVKRGDARSARNPFDLALYIALFPQLVAGPIVRFSTIAEQIRERRVTPEDVEAGARRFIVGLAKKVLVANSVAGSVDQIFGLPPEQLSSSLVWTASLLYTLQIYFDFSGYSDMAIGLGRIFGFRFEENFNYPYVSRSITDFWRRWHISLSTWFRDYLYIPLGGNRRGAFRTYVNLAIVFLLCGLWHGASWLFVAWGAYQGAFLIVERVGLGRLLERTPRIVQHAYAMAVVVVGWTIFRVATGPNQSADEVSLLSTCLGAMLGLHHPEIDRSVFEFVEPMSVIAAGCGILGSMPVVPWAARLAERGSGRLSAIARSAAVLACALLLILSVMSVASGAYNPFIYFQF